MITRKKQTNPGWDTLLDINLPGALVSVTLAVSNLSPQRQRVYVRILGDNAIILQKEFNVSSGRHVFRPTEPHKTIPFGRRLQIQTYVASLKEIDLLMYCSYDVSQDES